MSHAQVQCNHAWHQVRSIYRMLLSAWIPVWVYTCIKKKWMGLSDNLKIVPFWHIITFWLECLSNNGCWMILSEIPFCGGVVITRMMHGTVYNIFELIKRFWCPEMGQGGLTMAGLPRFWEQNAQTCNSDCMNAVLLNNKR